MREFLRQKHTHNCQQGLRFLFCFAVFQKAMQLDYGKTNKKHGLITPNLSLCTLKHSRQIAGK